MWKKQSSEANNYRTRSVLAAKRGNVCPERSERRRRPSAGCRPTCQRPRGEDAAGTALGHATSQPQYLTCQFVNLSIRPFAYFHTLTFPSRVRCSAAGRASPIPRQTDVSERAKRVTFTPVGARIFFTTSSHRSVTSQAITTASALTALMTSGASFSVPRIRMPPM